MCIVLCSGCFDVDIVCFHSGILYANSLSPGRCRSSLDGSTIGCAYVDVLCDFDYGYGINDATFSSDMDLLTTLLSHELGHNR